MALHETAIAGPAGPAGPAAPSTRPLTARPLRCRNCGAEYAPAPVAICAHCLGPLDPIYDSARPLPDRATIAARAPSLWRYREWLPFEGDPVLSLDSGFTPLLETPALARRLGVAGKVLGTAVYGARLVRVRGTYDDVNRLCAQVADRFGWGIVNVNLRGYYGEGSKTLAYEIVEQLGWRLPTAVVAPMAGGSLISKLRKGFGEFAAAGLARGPAPRLYGAQAAGCAPIVRLVERGAGEIEPERPHTICRSLAIGNPADGALAARTIRDTGGWAAAVSDPELVAGIRFLAEDTGVFAETAGGVTAAAARALAQ